MCDFVVFKAVETMICTIVQQYHTGLNQTELALLY